MPATRILSDVCGNRGVMALAVLGFLLSLLGLGLLSSLTLTTFGEEAASARGEAEEEAVSGVRLRNSWRYEAVRTLIIYWPRVRSPVSSSSLSSLCSLSLSLSLSLPLSLSSEALELNKELEFSAIQAILRHLDDNADGSVDHYESEEVSTRLAGGERERKREGGREGGREENE